MFTKTVTPNNFSSARPVLVAQSDLGYPSQSMEKKRIKQSEKKNVHTTEPPIANTHTSIGKILINSETNPDATLAQKAA